MNCVNRVNRVKDSAVSPNWRVYSHDVRGNVTGDGIHTFTYDYANQPITIAGADSGTYAYDGNLKRVKQIVGGQTIYSIYDRAGALLTRDNATTNAKTDYLAVAGQTFVRIRNNVASYPLNDHIGTPLAVAAQNGTIPASQTYSTTPFGEAWGAYSPGDSNEQGYTGHIEDAIGLTYMQARYYDPIMGRFLSTDPVGYLDQLNLYAYVHNDPVNNIDPSGLVTVYVWLPGPTPSWKSHAGHIAVLAEDGTYVSKFPSDSNKWKSDAVFHKPSDDAQVYASDYINDPDATWSFADNCADAVEQILNAGGMETDHNDPINTPQNLLQEITLPDDSDDRK